MPDPLHLFAAAAGACLACALALRWHRRRGEPPLRVIVHRGAHGCHRPEDAT